MIPAWILVGENTYRAQQFEEDDVTSYSFDAREWELMGVEEAPIDPNDIDGATERMALLKARRTSKLVLLPIRLLGKLSANSQRAFRHFALEAWNEWIELRKQQDGTAAGSV